MTDLPSSGGKEIVGLSQFLTRRKHAGRGEILPCWTKQTWREKHRTGNPFGRHRQTWPGRLSAVYAASLALALEHADIQLPRQAGVPVFDKIPLIPSGVPTNIFVADTVMAVQALTRLGC